MVMHENTDSIIRKSEVRKITGLSDTTIWRLEKLKKFPQRRRLSASACGWLMSEITNWAKTRPVVEIIEQTSLAPSHETGV